MFRESYEHIIHYYVENVGHVFNVTTLIRHATSVTYKVESIFEAVYRRCGWVSMSLGGQ